VGSIHGLGVEPAQAGVGAGADDEEGLALMEAVQPAEVQVAAVHDVESARLRQQQIEQMDVGALAVGEVEEAGNRATQVEQGVQLDGPLGGLEPRPGKHRQAQVNGGGIQGIDGLRQLDPEVLAGIEAAGDGDERLGEVSVDAPIAHLVGVGERVTSDRGAQPHVVQLGALRPQAGFDVAQALAVGQLREGHAEILVEAAELLDPVVAVIARHAPSEGVERQVVHDLREDELAGIHPGLPRVHAGKPSQSRPSRSSR
jgi:hypothetical protein